VECSGTLVAGQTKEAAVLRKAANRKKRTLAQHFFLLSLVIALRTPRQAQEAATQGTPISPSVFIREAVRWVRCFPFRKSLMIAVEVSRWRGFCLVKASAVGKARRPFIRLSEKYGL
jgi:hypothetical protein